MGTINAGLFSSATDEWPTPDDLFANLDSEFAFTLDPCADSDNAKCAKFFTKDDDGLSQPWSGAVFMNPPYGRQIGEWVRKAWLSSLEGATVVCLIPARTDTKYWHDYAMKASEVRFIKQRLHFSSRRHEERVASGAATAHNAPFPSVLLVFRPGHVGFPIMSSVDRLGRQLESQTSNCLR